MFLLDGSNQPEGMDLASRRAGDADLVIASCRRTGGADGQRRCTACARGKRHRTLTDGAGDAGGRSNNAAGQIHRSGKSIG